MKLFESINKKDLFLFALFAFLTFYIPFNEYGCTRNQAIGFVLVGIAAISSVHCNAMQIAFFLSYVAATAYPLFGVPLHISSLIELIFIGKVIQKFGLPSVGKLTIFVAVLSQLIPLIAFELNPMNIIKLIVNIALFFSIIQMYKLNNVTTSFIGFAFALGVLTSCVAGFYYVRPVTNSEFDITAGWMRYCALWTDPNFLSGFCLISICYLLRIESPNLMSKAIIYGMCALIFYFGTLTLSRTYLVVSIAMVGFFVLFVQRGGSSMRKIFISIMVLIVAFFAIARYVNKIDTNRIVGSEGATGGRLEASMALLEEQSNDIVASIMGVGYDNTEYLLTAENNLVAHNSYVEIIIQFGYLGVLIGLILLACNKNSVSAMLKSLRSSYGLPMMCLLFYMGTLSAVKYDFLFVITAIFIVEHRRNSLTTSIIT